MILLFSCSVDDRFAFVIGAVRSRNTFSFFLLQPATHLAINYTPIASNLIASKNREQTSLIEAGTLGNFPQSPRSEYKIKKSAPGVSSPKVQYM